MMLVAVAFYIGMMALTAIFIWTRSPPHKDWFALLMLVSCSALWPMLLAYAGYLMWQEKPDA